MPYSNILWVKTEIRLLNDYRHYSLPEESQLIFFKLLLLAGQTNNQIPKDPEILRSIFRSTLESTKIKESIDLIKINFPKFKENTHYYYFSEWSNRHNWVVPKDFQRSSKGVPKEATEKNRIDKNRIDPSVADAPEEEINKLIELFKPLNPLIYTNWFKIGAQRKAADRLCKKLGWENLCIAINSAMKAHTIKFAPHINSPIDLEKRLKELIDFSIKQKQITNFKGKEILGL